MQVEVDDAAAALEVLRKSSRYRQKAVTGLNVQSSRSHSVFCITLRWQPDVSSTCGNTGDEEAEGPSAAALFLGRLSFVDLAGECSACVKVAGMGMSAGSCMNSALADPDDAILFAFLNEPCM